MIRESRSSTRKVLEKIVNNSFAKAITKTPLRRATTGGVGGAALVYTIMSLNPQYREYLSHNPHPEALKLELSAFVIPVGMGVSLAVEYFNRVVEYTSKRVRQAYSNYKNR